MWTTQDPCLEKYFPTSPYAYCAANPIRFTDPTGKDAVFADKVSIWEIIHILLRLQNLIDDHLKIANKNGKFHLTYKERPVLTFFKGLLGVDKPQGTSLLREIIDHNKTLIIDCNNTLEKKDANNNTYTENICYQKSKNEQIVNFDLDINPKTWTINQNGDIRQEERPDFIGFGHEMIHGLRALNRETTSTHTSTKYFRRRDFLYKDQGYSDEEWSTIGIGSNPYRINENGLRKEHGLNPRICYFKPVYIFEPVDDL